MNKTARYWSCQVIGWGSWMMLQVFIAFQFVPLFISTDERRLRFFATLFSDFLWFIAATQMLRLILKKLDWLSFAPEKVFVTFIAGVLFTSAVSFYGSKYSVELTNLSYEKLEIRDNLKKAQEKEDDLKYANTDYFIYQNGGVVDSANLVFVEKIKQGTGWSRDAAGKWHFEDQRKGRAFWGVVFNFILTSLWLLIYLVWHYVEKNRRDRWDTLRLEGVVKSLELKTIKSHINPHFIFNALNSIRALVDENPPRARTAITELSNILRSSLKAESLETVPLQQELDIVQDYLALEHMRFEERLRIEMEIDPDTLSQPIPPMMLQTLVENAIKHGISKDVRGGLIRICSYFKNNHHELIVQNTGDLRLLKAATVQGFGLKSTQDRLNLLYNNKARFEIEEKEGNLVQSKVIMPITQIL